MQLWWSLTLAGVILVLSGCGSAQEPQMRTDLSIEIATGFGSSHHRVTCDPSGGDAHDPSVLCGLLATHADVMLFPPPGESCVGGPSTYHIRVTGTYDGRSVDTEDVDACSGNLKAERYWLSQLDPPRTSR
jgi:hypothetical protein